MAQTSPDVTTQPANPSALRRAITGVGSFSLTAATVGGAVAAVIAGTELLETRAEASQPEVIATGQPVQTIAARTQDGFTLTRQFTGRIEAPQDSALGFELPGRIAEITVEEGDTVTAGQVLARLDIALLQDEHAQLTASLEALSVRRDQALAVAERRRALAERGHVAAEALDAAETSLAELGARMAEMRAAIASVETRLEKSVLTAPFSGTVGVRNVDLGAVIGAGAPVVTLLQDGAPRLRVGLPLSVSAEDAALATLTALPGATLEFEGFRRDLDPGTRTRTALYRLTGDTSAIWGQTVTLALPQTVEQPGTWVQTAALREGAEGLWTVLVIDADSRARPAAVEVLHSDGARAYVRGSFAPDALLIAAGAHRVEPGQLVEALTASANEARVDG